MRDERRAARAGTGRMSNVRRILLIVVALAACRGTSPSAQAVDQRQLAILVDSLMPGVAKAAGLQFKSTPKSAIRSRDQIRAYLVAKLDRDLPAARLEGITDTYRLLGMIPDTLELRQLFLALYTEQIAGFYDPDSTTLFAVKGADPAQLRLVLAHELVHALQHEYVPLDSILHDVTDGDRQAAAQAVMEGQATLVSLVAMLPGMNIQTDDAFWDSFRDQLARQQFGQSVFASAPMAIREALVFPYVEGASFSVPTTGLIRARCRSAPPCRPRPSRSSTPIATNAATCRSPSGSAATPPG